MNRTLTIVVLLILAVGFSVFAQDTAQLVKIKKIYLGDLGKEEGADLVKEKLRLRLMKSERFVVVETPEEADAVLTGVAGYGSDNSGLGALRLVNPNTKTTIWGFEYKPGRSVFGGGSASTRVAEKTVEQLLKDTKEAEKKVEK